MTDESAFRVRTVQAWGALRMRERFAYLRGTSGCGRVLAMAKWERPTPARQVPVHRARAYGSAPTSPVAEDSAVWPTCKRARTVSRASGRQQGCGDTGTRRGQEPHDDGSGDRRAGTAIRCRAMPRRLRGTEGSSAAASPPAEDAHRRRAPRRRCGIMLVRQAQPPSAGVGSTAIGSTASTTENGFASRPTVDTRTRPVRDPLGCRLPHPGVPGTGHLPVSVPGGCGDPMPGAKGRWRVALEGHGSGPHPRRWGCGPELLCVTAYSSAYLRIRLRSTYCMMPPLR